MSATDRFFRPEIDKAKAFVKKYQTPVACTVTAVATFALTRKQYLNISKEFAYAVGHRAGNDVAQIGILQQFIEQKGLKEEFLTGFLPNVDMLQDFANARIAEYVDNPMG